MDIFIIAGVVLVTFLVAAWWANENHKDQQGRD